MPGELIVSLTSYRPRFSTLSGTIKSLLTQNITPDRIILWVGEDDIGAVPDYIRRWERSGLEIRPCVDVGPYTKIIPALEAFPGAFIVTADDDVFYRADWLKTLIENWDGRMNQIVCHRAHEVSRDAEGLPRPYETWKFDIPGPLERADIFPTGVGGVLYPPGSLHNDVTNARLFLELSPKADDVWLYWMGRCQGAIYKKTPGKRLLVYAPGSQDVGLLNENLFNSENDGKIRAMIEHYGWFRD
ncbi:MAG: glycosyltransferase family 2 protein [Spartobacteria bacterium]|nr:glycosyltransferase family 2 protein [Spartobacteria bacterium]